MAAFAATLTAHAGSPAARVGDMTTCPAVTAVVPHVGGPISTGSPRVFICGLPAASVGSLITEVGPPGVVSSGSRSVFVEGRPVAFAGSTTAHGGSVVMGCPTVLVAP